MMVEIKKGRHGSSKRKRLERKICKTWPSYTSWSNQDQWQMSPYSFKVISLAIVPLHLMMHKLGLIFVLTSRNPLNVSLSMQCVCHGSNKKKTIVLYVCLFYHHLLISGDITHMDQMLIIFYNDTHKSR
jgi:hypothetical protein